MTRHSLFAAGLVGLLALSACSTVEAQRYPTPRRGGTVYQPAPRQADYRGADARDAAGIRVTRDVRQYVNRLDRQLRLSNRQERQIREVLQNRTRRLLRGTRPGEARRVYPFPRRLGQRQYANRSVASFWRDADNRVERLLSRDQRREFQYLTGQRRNDRRGRRN